MENVETVQTVSLDPMGHKTTSYICKYAYTKLVERHCFRRLMHAVNTLCFDSALKCACLFKGEEAEGDAGDGAAAG